MCSCLPCHPFRWIVFSKQMVETKSDSVSALGSKNCEFAGNAPRLGVKQVAASKSRPSEVAAINYLPSAVTDVFFDFDGTLTAGSLRAHEYLLPLLEHQRGVRVWDSSGMAASPSGAISWAQLDAAMAACVPEAGIDFSDASVFGTRATRKLLQDALVAMKLRGVRMHLLTMGTPLTCQALLKGAGYDINVFQEWLGPSDMAHNQGLQHLFENGHENSFEFSVEEDILALEVLRDTGTLAPLIRRILTMELRLSKARLVSVCAGHGGLLVDDNWSKNIFDAKSRGIMYIHVDPEGVEHTCERIRSLLGKLDRGPNASVE